MSERLDWRLWHRDYDDPESSVSHRLVEVRARLGSALAAGSDDPVRLLSLCAGDGRDVIPVVAVTGRRVSVTLVELDPVLAEAARRAAAEAGVVVDVLTGDASEPTLFADVLPVDVLVLVGVLGNVSDADAGRLVTAIPSMVAPGGVVIWSRSNRFRTTATHAVSDPALWVRGLFEAAGLETVDYLVPDEEAWRLGVSRLRVDAPRPPVPTASLFTFIR
jgi:2-polyprenyl-3-methyl-5-hydroxy-6-metoxy-1,4-benzoquinol methylase